MAESVEEFQRKPYYYQLTYFTMVRNRLANRKA